MGISNYPEKVHGRNTVLPNIWSRSNHTGRSELVQCLGFKIQSRQEFRVDAEIVGPVARTLGINDYIVVKISAITCSKIQQGYGEKGV